MSEQDAAQHAKVWHHAADELAKTMKLAEESGDWGTWRSTSATCCLARFVAEGYEQLAEGKIGI